MQAQEGVVSPGKAGSRVGSRAGSRAGAASPSLDPSASFVSPRRAVASLLHMGTIKKRGARPQPLLLSPASMRPPRAGEELRPAPTLRPHSGAALEAAPASGTATRAGADLASDMDAFLLSPRALNASSSASAATRPGPPMPGAGEVGADGRTPGPAAAASASRDWPALASDFEAPLIDAAAMEAFEYALLQGSPLRRRPATLGGSRGTLGPAEDGLHLGEEAEALEALAAAASIAASGSRRASASALLRRKSTETPGLPSSINAALSSLALPDPRVESPDHQAGPSGRQQQLGPVGEAALSAGRSSGGGILQAGSSDPRSSSPLSAFMADLVASGPSNQRGLAGGSGGTAAGGNNGRSGGDSSASGVVAVRPARGPSPLGQRSSGVADGSGEGQQQQQSAGVSWRQNPLGSSPVPQE